MSSEKSTKALDEMRSASLDEASDLLRQIAGGRHADESMKAMFRRLARQLSHWSENRIMDVWRRDPRVRVRAEEVDQLRALVDRSAVGNVADELRDLRETVARLSKYEALLQRIDAGFYGGEIAAARDQIGAAREILGERRSRSGS